MLARRRAPKVPAIALPALPSVPARTRRIAALSSACAVVLAVGAGSAMFVDYLADRAMARAADTIPVKVVREIRIASDGTIASDATDSDDPAPIVRPPEIIAEPRVGSVAECLGHACAAVACRRIGATRPADRRGRNRCPGADPGRGRARRRLGGDRPRARRRFRSRRRAEERGEAGQAAKKTASLPDEPADDELEALPGVDVGGLAGNPSGSSASGASRKARIVKGVNMRARGQQGAKVLTVIPAGTTVDLFGCEQWCEVSYKGRKGWVYKSFVGTSQASAAKPEKAEKQAADAPTHPPADACISSRAQ